MLCCIILLASGFRPALAAETGQAMDAPLYKRLGGYDAIVAVTEDLLPRLVNDQQLGRFWANRGKDGVAREKQLVIDYIVAKSGGPLTYVGRELKGSHTGMKITEADWSAFRKHLDLTLDKFKLPERERREVLSFFESTKKDILD